MESVTEKLEAYEFSAAGETLRDFTWSEFADWYLEIAKLQLIDPALKKNTEQILLYLLKRLLILWHPFMPFVTEEIWKVFPVDEPLLIHAWPKTAPKKDKEAEEQLAILRDVIVAVRNLRSQYHVEAGKKIEARVIVSRDGIPLKIFPPLITPGEWEFEIPVEQALWAIQYDPATVKGKPVIGLFHKELRVSYTP